MSTNDITFATRPSLGKEYWANHRGDDIFHSRDPKGRLNHQERAEAHRSSRLEISKLLSTLLSCPAKDISQIAWEEKGSLQLNTKLTSTIWTCSLASSQHARPGPLSSPGYPSPLLPLLSGITQAAAAANSGRQHGCHHVTQRQTSPSSAVPAVTEIWELSSALRIKPTLSVSQTTPVRTWRLGCNALQPRTPTRFVSNGDLF